MDPLHILLEYLAEVSAVDKSSLSALLSPNVILIGGSELRYGPRP